MTPRTLGLVLGLLYLGLGVLGMMPGMLAGLVPLHPGVALVHFAMGAWGLAAYAGWAAARTYACSAAFIFAALGLAGMLDGLDRLLMLHGPVVWVHLASAGVAGFVGWKPRSGERRSLAGDRRRARGAPMASERRYATYDRRKTPAAA